MADDERDKDFKIDAGKRAHHNALERKRRNGIRDGFITLKNALPIFQSGKVRGSTQNISKEAVKYIMDMRTKNSDLQQDIDNIRQQKKMLEDQIRVLEQAKATGNFAAVAAVREAIRLTNNRIGSASLCDGDSDSDDSDDS